MTKYCNLIGLWSEIYLNRFKVQFHLANSHYMIVWQMKDPPMATSFQQIAIPFGLEIVHAQFIISLKDINFKSPRQGDLFQLQFIKNKWLNNISVGVVPLRELI